LQAKVIHIITHEVPYPADFGGVIDLFYKIKTLHQLGIGIHLHCFTNKRPKQKELEAYCISVNYYPRKKIVSFRLPYIISSRKSNELLQQLNQDHHPILFEGVHCTYHLLSGALKNRTMLLRLHNVECEYYKQLFYHEKKLLRKIYFGLESILLKKSEKLLARKVKIAAVSEQDAKYYAHVFHAKNVFYLPVFIPFSTVNGQVGCGNFCLYHGNLSINENEEAAIWLLKNVFDSVKIPFVIAGKNPSTKLTELAHQQDHTCLVANPSDKELQDLISKAQINILPSLNNTGVKLKLLNAGFMDFAFSL
jgi:glycosyltransferase involved in cell wall biosynthesis